MRFVALCVIAACGSAPVQHTAQPTGLQRVDAKGIFEFEAPAPVRELKTHGIDSLVGAYEVGGCRLYFDYGDYSNDVTPWSVYWPADYRYRVGTLDGHPTRWATWSATRDDGTVVFSAALHVFSGLTVFADCPRADLVPAAVHVLETIRTHAPIPVDDRRGAPHGPPTWSAPDVTCRTETWPAKGSTIAVTVVDEHERPVDNAFVYIAVGLAITDASSDRSGNATLDIAPGTYDVRADVSATRLMGNAVATLSGMTEAGGWCRGVIAKPNTQTNVVLRVRWY